MATKTREVEHMKSIRYLPAMGTADQLASFEIVKGVQAAIMEIDALIYRYALALEVVQPPAQGKIAIRFLRRQWGETDSRHPQFVQWHQSPSGRWLYTRLKPGEVLRKLKSYGVFMATREDAREILIETRALVEMRESLQKDLGNVRRTLAMHTSKVRTAFEPYKSNIDEWMGKITTRRQEIIANSRAVKEYAAEALAEMPNVEMDTRPAVNPTGRTRGSRSVTSPRERRE